MGTSASFVPAAVPECPYAPRMTRAAAMALRTAGGLLENCVVVITDGPIIGTAGNTSQTEIELNPVSPTELGTTARVHTGFAVSAWAGIYDIDLGTAGSITQLEDDWGNTAKDIDADSPTVHTQFPWHLGSATLRDNYVEDAVLPGWDTYNVVNNRSGNKVIDSTMDLTGHTSGGGGFLNNEFTGTTFTGGGAGAFLAANRCQFIASTVNFGANTAIGTVSLTNTVFEAATITKDATSTGGVTISNSEIRDSTLTQGAGSTGAMTVTDSQVTATSALNVDPASAKSIGVTGSELLGYSIRTQDAGAGTASTSRSNCFGKPNTGDSILVHGTNAGGTGPGVSVNNSVVDGFSGAIAGAGSIDINGPAQSALIQDAAIQNSRFTIGPGAGAFQTTGGIYEQAVINALSPGRLTINFSYVTGGGTVNHALAATDSLNLNTVRVDGTGGLVELLSGARGLALTNTQVTNGIIRQSSVNAASVPNQNTVQDIRVIDTGRVIFSDTGATAAGHVVSRSTIKGSSLGGGVDGILTITGTSQAVFVDSVFIQGVTTLTDVPAGALSGPTAFYDLRVGTGSTLTYTAGDNATKQIRNITVEDLSSLVITNLTGAAGAGLADVFAGTVQHQSTMTVTGARVVGQPVRNFTVANNSALNVAASGTVLQVRVAEGATLNTGAFRHSESIIDGAITKTATAANVNRLANKSFDDWI